MPDSAALSIILNTGAVGVVLLWFMLRAEPRLARLESAVDRLSRAILIDRLAQDDVSPMVKREAKKLLAELNTAQSKRTPLEAQA